MVGGWLGRSIILRGKRNGWFKACLFELLSLLVGGGSLGIGGGRGGGEKVVDWCLFEFNVGAQVLRVFQMLVGVPDIFCGGGVLCGTTFFQVGDS